MQWLLFILLLVAVPLVPMVYFVRRGLKANGIKLWSLEAWVGRDILNASKISKENPGDLRDAYEAALLHLERAPESVECRKKALEVGRACFMVEGWRPEAIELRIKADMDARTGGK